MTLERSLLDRLSAGGGPPALAVYADYLLEAAVGPGSALNALLGEPRVAFVDALRCRLSAGTATREDVVLVFRSDGEEWALLPGPPGPSGGRLRPVVPHALHAQTVLRSADRRWLFLAARASGVGPCVRLGAWPELGWHLLGVVLPLSGGEPRPERIEADCGVVCLDLEDPPTACWIALPELPGDHPRLTGCGAAVEEALGALIALFRSRYRR